VFSSNGIVTERGPVELESSSIGVLDVDADYFAVLRLGLRSGRYFQPGESASSAIVTETFANRYWPGEDALGRRFQMTTEEPWHVIVGVVRHARTSADPLGAASQTGFQIYVPRQPPPPPPPPGRSAGSLSFINLVVRLDQPSRLNDLVQTVRSADSRILINAEFIDDVYARQFDTTLLATRVVGGFGVLAFVIATGGVYAVMAFLVATRRRELGIRIALGAGPAAVVRLILRSSLTLAIAGVVFGLLGAFVASRWIEAQLFGVRAFDPMTYGIVAVAILGAATAAAIYPARRALMIDPVETLRAE
jgi:hypothetical protein